ncbi:alpha-L-rhamnosidase C-terminal domain-containing protein [Mumia sp. DW29H23]|uniref:alpha-L-rhamnosidase C-terminal domain-containing protein n=1 Tax=Mumia sp. DW29H23 TaxID=3421241 RepID=UPI003D6964DF
MGELVQGSGTAKTSVLIASLALVGAIAVPVAADGVTARGPDGASGMLGLPPLSQADRYVLAPSSRTVRPVTVAESSEVNHDYVTASSAASEDAAHGLDVGTSDTATVGGLKVRRAGVGVAGGHFSYQLRVPAHRAFDLRVEEAGSAGARYEVLVDGQVVHTRTMALYAAQGRPIGATHYSVRVPARAVSSPTVEVTFRNLENPGDGARIAGVWASSTRTAAAEPGYGGSARNPRGAAGRGETHLDAGFFAKPYVIYDFGQEVGGTISLNASDVEGAPRLGLAFSESDTYMTSVSDYSQDPSGVATETHYFALDKDGPVEDEVIRGGFRYLMVFLDSPGSATLSDLELTFTADPTNPDLDDYKGAFLSSDRELNELWYAGAYTAQMSTIASDTGRPYPATPGPVRNDQLVAQGEAFLSDGAKRDRYDWGGDNVVSNTVAYLTTGASEPAKNAVEWFAAHPSADGQIPGVYLPEPAGFTYNWGEYASWWMQNYWTHYLYTGDKTFLSRWFDALKGNVAWAEKNVDDDGLWDVPGSASGHWGYGQAGKETYNNLVYVKGLRSAVSAAQELGEDDLAATWTAAADRTAKAVADTLWDDEAGAFRTIAGSKAHPLDANALAIVTGVATREQTQRILEFFEAKLATPHGERGVDTTEGNAVPDYISPFVASHELAAYAEAGDAEGALSVLRRTWGHMLDGPDSTKTFWETVSPDGGLGLGAYTSQSHGWAAAPTNFLTQEVLGVTPTEAGFREFEVAPTPVDGLSWAQGAVPTPHGTITTAWRTDKRGLRVAVEAPDGTTYAVRLPGAAGSEVTVDGRAVQARSDDGALVVEGLTGDSTLTVTRSGR